MSKTTDYRFKAIYAKFLEKYPDTDITYSLFFFIIREYNLKLVGAILDGIAVRMGHNLGQLKIARIQRNHEKPAVNWQETQELRKETGDKDVLVFYTDDWYYRHKWVKGKVTNISYYKWYPTKNMRKRLINILKHDPLGKLNFK